MTPTLKAAEVAAAETGADGHSAAWLIHQHGWRWDDDGHWTRQPDPAPDPAARLRPGDLLLVDEAGMLDQDTARALLTIADETGARVALVGDRHQLPAVGRGGVLDHAVAWAHPTAVVTLEKVHRFTDPDYAALSLRMRTGDDPGAVFDALHRRGQIVDPPQRGRTHRRPRRRRRGRRPGHRRHPRAGRRPQRRHPRPPPRRPRHGRLGRRDHRPLAASGSGSGTGSPPAATTPTSQVANRQTWTVTGIGEDGSLILHGRGRDREIPAEYATRFVELAYATTVHGAQGETVDRAHVADRRAHRRRGGVRRDDPRPRHATPPTWSPRPSTTPASSGSRSSAATAPTSDPPTPDARRSTPSTATARRTARQPRRRAPPPVPTPGIGL